MEVPVLPFDLSGGPAADRRRGADRRTPGYGFRKGRRAGDLSLPQLWQPDRDGRNHCGHALLLLPQPCGIAGKAHRRYAARRGAALCRRSAKGHDVLHGLGAAQAFCAQRVFQRAAGTGDDGRILSPFCDRLRGGRGHRRRRPPGQRGGDAQVHHHQHAALPCATRGTLQLPGHHASGAVQRQPQA